MLLVIKMLQRVSRSPAALYSTCLCQKGKQKYLVVIPADSPVETHKVALNNPFQVFFFCMLIFILRAMTQLVLFQMTTS